MAKSSFSEMLNPRFAKIEADARAAGYDTSDKTQMALSRAVRLAMMKAPMAHPNETDGPRRAKVNRW